MTRIVAVASQKGGVGKTTTSINLARMLSLAGHRTLLADLDPQANATSGVGGDYASEPRWPGLLASGNWHDAIVSTAFPDLDLVPSAPNHDYAKAVAEAPSEAIGELRQQLDSLEPSYDFVLLDCPPATGPIPYFALRWADSVLIPVQCEYFAMEGLSQMIPTVERANRTRGTNLEIEAILLTLYDDSVGLSREILGEVRQHFPRDTSDVVIPRDPMIVEAASHGLPIFDYDVRAHGTWSYLRLAKELINGV